MQQRATATRAVAAPTLSRQLQVSATVAALQGEEFRLNVPESCFRDVCAHVDGVTMQFSL